MVFVVVAVVSAAVVLVTVPVLVMTKLSAVVFSEVLTYNIASYVFKASFAVAKAVRDVSNKPLAVVLAPVVPVPTPPRELTTASYNALTGSFM